MSTRPQSRPRRLVALAVLAGVCAGACAEETAPDVRPDILLVSIDSLRHDHLGCYGYGAPTSPTIDALAAQGARFEHALSTTSWTLPAHAALFTGLTDSAHGLTDNGLSLSESHRTLAEVLRESGYRTAGFFGGPYLHPTFGLGQGFEHYQSCMTTLEDALPGDEVRVQSRAREGASHRDITGPRTLQELERWLPGAGTDKPLFLFVHLWDVHYDYLAPKEYVERFDPGYTGTLSGERFLLDPAIQPRMDPRDYRHLMALYDAEIRFTDDILARILGLLEARGRRDQTLVVVTADHGEEFFEHGGKGHQRTLFEEVVRVPLIVRWPGRFGAPHGPAAVPDQVSLIDVMPTVLTAAGVRRRPLMQGRDLTPLLLGRSLPPQPALLELLVDRRELRALRTNAFKTVSPGGGIEPGGFDLVADPREQQVLRGDDARVSAGLQQLELSLQAARELATRLQAGASSVDIDPAVLLELKRLGYAVGTDDK